MGALGFRLFQHLLPDAHAWRITITKTLRKFFEGLSALPEAARQFADEVHGDAFPDTTRELAEWEAQFGLDANPDTAIRRLQLTAAWRASGGQSPNYIQGVLQAAGFDVYVHEWWESGPPYVARDPRDYTDSPLIGTWQCTGDPGAPIVGQPQCTGNTPDGNRIAGQPQCNSFLANNPRYIVNKDLTPRAPPPIPDHPSTWPYFLYVGGETFPDLAIVPAERRDEFERFILKIRPTQNWIVLLIDYGDEGGGIFDDSFGSTFE
jgi:hypothetical protein